ncbi:hypothetical protein Z043_117197, partial [Scleropages formosus]
PNVIDERKATSFSTNSSQKTGPFNLASPSLSTYNQQLWLTCQIELDQTHGVDFTQHVEIIVDLKGVMQDASVTPISPRVHQRSRTLHCRDTCDEIIVVHLGYLNYTQYQIKVTFEGLQNLTFSVRDVTFMWKLYNPSFSQVEIWFRFVFVVLTFMVTCVFAHSLRKFSMRDWGIEQKWMSILLPLLLLYNDPFFPLSFLVNSWFPGTLDTLFQAMFLCALLLFWLCVYHGIRVQVTVTLTPESYGGSPRPAGGAEPCESECCRCAFQGERKCLTFYLPKLLIVGLLWLSAITLGIWQTVNELHDPTYQYKVDIRNFQGMKIFFVMVVCVYVLYLIFLIVRACSELKNMPYSDLRLKFLTGLTFIVLIISVVILYLRFGAKLLQDNFVAALSTHYKNYILSFVYSPSKNALYDSQLKDNPAFSMLNDSEDEVIYGSDYEEMPLQNGRAIKATAKYQDESDSD